MILKSVHPIIKEYVFKEILKESSLEKKKAKEIRKAKIKKFKITNIIEEKI